VNIWLWVALSPLFWFMIAIPAAVFVGKFIKAGSGESDEWDQRLFR